MNIVNKIYCRIYQGVFRLAMPFLPYREPEKFESTDDIAPLLKKLNIDSVLLITDSFLRNSGITKNLEENLAENNINVTVFDKTNPNPTTKNVYEAKEMYLNNGCKGLIAFGGGSSIDCAKAVGGLIVYPNKKMKDIKGLLKIWRKLPTLIAIPTTAGTGSEVTVTSVITNPEKKHKYTINSFPLIPHYAVLDAKVTYTLPKSITATTGMDALVHAVEAYIGNSTTKETRRLALEATELIFKNIEIAYNEPENYTARSNMLIAAHKAGIAFSKSYVGYIHAIAHSLGGQYNVPHGLANSVIMPYVLDIYGEKIHKKLYQLGIAAGVASENDGTEAGAKKFIKALKELNKRLEIPEKIVGIKREDIPLMAKHAHKEANPLYPVPLLMNDHELKDIYFKIAEWK